MKKLILLLSFLFIPNFASAESFCDTDDCSGSPTLTFTAYIQQLAESGFITEKSFSTFSESLAKGELVNPVSKNYNSESLIHFNGIQEYIDYKEELELDIFQILQFAEQILQRMRQVIQEKKSVSMEFTSPQFHKVKKGSYYKGKELLFPTGFDFWFSPSIVFSWLTIEWYGYYFEYDYALMDIEVTQNMFFIVMGYNPSFHKGLNNPVETITLQEIELFTTKLNKMSMDDHDLIYKIFPDHKKGSWYRLPTLQEWLFIADYADDHYKRTASWTSDNSDNKTHVVKQKEPLKVEGIGEFYDIFGNVDEKTYVHVGPLLVPFIRWVIQPGSPLFKRPRVSSTNSKHSGLHISESVAVSSCGGSSESSGSLECSYGEFVPRRRSQIIRSNPPILNRITYFSDSASSFGGFRLVRTNTPTEDQEFLLEDPEIRIH